MTNHHVHAHSLHNDLLMALHARCWDKARKLADELCLVGREHGSLPPQCSVDAASWWAPEVVTGRLELVDSYASRG